MSDLVSKGKHFSRNKPSTKRDLVKVENSNSGSDTKSKNLGGVTYDDRIRVREKQDPIGHVFPFQFDEIILSTKPTKLENGNLGYAVRGANKIRNKRGSNRDTEIIFNIIVNQQNVIVHRDKIKPSQWPQRAKEFGWPIKLEDIPKYLG